MTAKYINMSIVGLWQVNAVCLLVVVAWWMRALIEQLPQQRSGSARSALRIGPKELILRRGSPQSEAAFGLALLLLLFLCTITDLRNPSLYAIPAYRTHPTVVNYVLGGPERYPCGGRTGCTAVPVSPLDVELVDRLTKPTERVALLAFQDWTTLIEARRASKFHFLPSAVLFTERQLGIRFAISTLSCCRAIPPTRSASPIPTWRRACFPCCGKTSRSWPKRRPCWHGAGPAATPVPPDSTRPSKP